MRAVALGAMLVVGDRLSAPAAAQVRRDARAFVQDLDGGGSRADFDQFVHQVVGHAVEVGVKGDVVVDVDPGARPFAQVERFGGQWLQSRPVQSLEHRGPALLALAERPVIQLGEQLANGLVQIFEQEELAMAQRRHDPALGDLHGVFDFGFVSRLVRPRGHDAKAAVQREVVIGRIQIRIVTVCFGDTGLGVVRNRQRRNAAEVFKGVHVGAQPRLHLLIARSLCPGVGTGAQRGHEQWRLPGEAGVAIPNRNRRAGPIHEHLFPGFVFLPQNHVELRSPALVQLAEARVAIALRVPLPVFLP